MKHNTIRTRRLMTAAGKQMPEVPWNVYPRPQMVRPEWLCLNGTWELRSGKKQGSILVPFCPESLLSGSEIVPEPGQEFTCARSFRIPEDWKDRADCRVLLHFGAVSGQCRVFVNGNKVCEHRNGYLPFSVDITDALRQGDNRLEAAVVNDLSPEFPLGKQSRTRGGMWYTPCSGIWQTVWLEPVPEEHIRGLEISVTCHSAHIRADGMADGTIEIDGRRIPMVQGEAEVLFDAPRLWCPEDPWLYRFAVVSGSDRVESYLALRTLETKKIGGIPRLCLNGAPVFFNGLLDQGYWSDGLYTPASPDGYEKDICAMQALGYNTLRKHIKIEPEQFYYDCDRLGMLVFQDMVNHGLYRFFRDTALPTVGIQRLPDLFLNRDEKTRAAFLHSMEATVLHLQNHPCICLWTIFNEGWGQFCADDAYRRLKALDSSRFIDSTSGWFHQKLSDVDSLHIYFKKLRLGREKLPQLLSEFGGYVWKVPEHSFNLDKTYGYRICPNRENFQRDFLRLYEKQVLPLAEKGLCGAIYTQVSDVEDETNGLLTFDRAVCKLSPEAVRPIMDCILRAVNSAGEVDSHAS